jgi:hypothetical protein
MARALFRLPSIAAIAGAVACSLAVDTSDIDSGCGPNRKFCDGTCVSVDEPAYGCTQEGCAPCQRDLLGEPFGDRLIPKCENNVCVPDRCAFGYGCEGCKERILTNPFHCGSCFNRCDPGLTCSLGECVGAGGAGGEAGN